ncbi:hypothetical protein ABPG73_017093 [Tetrahymena malaccensis]
MQNQSQFYINELKSYFISQDKSDIEFEETMHTLKLERNSINESIYNYQKRDNSKNNESTIQKKQLIFNKVFKRFKVTESQLINQKQYAFERDLRVSEGLLISSKGIIRTDYSIIQLSFGYLYNAQTVKFLKKKYIIEVQYEQIQPIHEVTLEEAQNYLSQTSCQQLQQSFYVLQSIYEQKRILRDSLDYLKMTKDLIQLHNQQLNQFIQNCDTFIEQYNQKKEGAIFQYFIRKINLNTKAEEIVKVGYSMSFLDLIGVSVDRFCSIILSNQKLDLVQNEQEILNQSLNGIRGYFQNNCFYKNQSKLITLDGYCLNFSYSFEHINLSEQFQLNLQLPFKQTITITKIHVDIEERKNLINFRLANLRSKRNLPIQEQVQQELQNLYQNSTSPIQYQRFIQKYYEQNIKEVYKQKIQCI